MQVIELKTLIDITNTKVIRPVQGSQLELDQQRNFITLTQCIELRSIIHYEIGPVCEKVDIRSLGFGNAYKGRQNVWTFRFVPDRESVYLDADGNSIGSLINDLHEVPVIKNLSETINIVKAYFDLKDEALQNTVITASQGQI